jgi:hypothetical protein
MIHGQQNVKNYVFVYTAAILKQLTVERQQSVPLNLESVTRFISLMCVYMMQGLKLLLTVQNPACED